MNRKTQITIDPVFGTLRTRRLIPGLFSGDGVLVTRIALGVEIIFDVVNKS